MLRTCTVYLIFTAIFISYCDAREYPFQHYGTKEGLPHTIVYRIYQDQKGFMWFCTEYGVSKFNGKVFKNYTTNDGLSSNVTISVSEDANSNILVNTYYGGINIISDTSSGIRVLKTKSDALSKRVAYSLPYKNDLWVITFHKGGSLFLIRDGIVHNILLKNSLGAAVTIYKLFRFDNEILFATSDGVYKAADTVAVKCFPQSIKNAPIASIAADRHGGYWIGSKNKIIYVLNDSIVHTYSFKKGNEISDILLDKEHKLWIAAGNTIFLIEHNILRDMSRQIKIPKMIITDLC